MTPSFVDPRSPSALRTLLQDRGVAPQKRWGQHFLTDRNVLEKMVRLAHGGGRHCLEIGSGPGGLTLTLLEAGWSVTALEVDPRMVEILAGLGAHYPGILQVVASDVLAVSWSDLFGDETEPVTIFGNLPYYITGPILAKLWEDRLVWNQAVVMVQQEVAERILTPIGERATTVLSVLLRYHAEIKRGLKVPRQCFFPVPDVDSEVLVLEKLAPPDVSWEAFHTVVRQGFRQRRKTLAQGLSGLGEGAAFWKERLASMDIDPMRRAETLTMEEWVRLAHAAEHLPHRASGKE